MATPLYEAGRATRPPARERSLTELIRDLADEATTLVREEIELAKAELSQKADQARKAAVPLAVAALLGIGAFAALTAFLILALSYVMPSALAALVVTLLYAVVAAILYGRGRRQLQEAAPLVPEETLETVKDDVTWLKNRRSSANA